MIKAHCSEVDITELIASCLNKFDKGEYKYFTDISVDESDPFAYENWFEECNNMGFDFCFLYIYEGTNLKSIHGFSNFEIVPLYDFAPERIKSSNKNVEETFMFLAEKAEYFLIAHH